MVLHVHEVVLQLLVLEARQDLYHPPLCVIPPSLHGSVTSVDVIPMSVVPPVTDAKVCKVIGFCVQTSCCSISGIGPPSGRT